MAPRSSIGFLRCVRARTLRRGGDGAWCKRSAHECNFSMLCDCTGRARSDAALSPCLPLYLLAYWHAQSWQSSLKTCFLLAAVVNAFSVRRILRAFHRRGEDDRKRAQLFALIAKACKEQIKSANCTIGRCIDHQSTPLLLRDESFILDCIAADWWESGSPGLIASRAASHCSLSTPSTRRYDSYTRK